MINKNLPSQMSHQFSQVPTAKIERSTFKRDHCYKTTFDEMNLVPFYVDEALPGDTFKVNANLLCRMNTPIKPIMDNIYLDIQYWAVPRRLTWSHWEKFNGAQDNPGDSTSFLEPQVTGPGGGGIVAGSLADYFGLPINVAGLKFNAHPFRAYNLIYNTWYRDQNLQNSVIVDLGDGPDAYTDYALLARGKRHDYFTSCLPWPQKGTAVTIPAGASSAPVNYVAHTVSTNPMLIRKAADDTLNNTGSNLGSNAADASLTDVTSGNKLILDPNGRLIADLSSAFATTINSLRQAVTLQQLYERDARGGTRYIEIIKAHFKVTSPDARLQRPEFLGGGTVQINTHPVPNTTMSTGGTSGGQQGNLAGFSVGSGQNIGFTKSFTEHCTIIGIFSVRADLTYQQGIDRMWSRRTRVDHFWPDLAHMGEQAVLNQEIYSDGSVNDTLVFGYQERYAEYRYKPSLITGKFRSTYSTPLDVWHLAEKFGSLPTLGASFIASAPPVSRVVAVPSEPHFMIDMFIQNSTTRPIPLYGVPGLLRL